MSVHAPQKGVALSAEDRARMTRLREEVEGRLKEMALIGARTLGIELPADAQPVFDPSHHDERFAGRGGETADDDVVLGPDEAVGILIVVTTDRGRICYADPPGICIPC